MPKKIVLAYSGGLDTAVILRWLQKTYECEVATFTADIGNVDDLDQIEAKAHASGIKEIFVRDLTEEFVADYVFPMFRANALYEGIYLLGTSIARPLIAKHLVDIAREIGADAISHGATGKGNDQIRFELGAYALMPEIQVISPWREWTLESRDDLLDFADAEGIEVEKRAGGKANYSMDTNLLHTSYEGGELEDPWHPPQEDMWRHSVNPLNAPDDPETIEITFENGNAVQFNKDAGTPAQILTWLNEAGGRHGIGRVDIVENRYIGMKSRGCYETPGGTILHTAHRAMESLTLDREIMHLKEDLAPRYSRLVYNGYWWSPERIALQDMIDSTQEHVNGVVKLRLYKGSVTVLGRKSQFSMYDEAIASFDDTTGAYTQSDAAGFIRLNALRLRVAAAKGRQL